MNIVSLNETNDQDVLSAAEEVLRRGGVVVSPTDTVYGLLGDGANETAVRRMFAMKKRPEQKAFPVFVSGVPMARIYSYISDAKARFLDGIWPGPVIVVFHHKEKMPALLTGGRDTIGMRMPDRAFVLDLVARMGRPLAQTSANISSRPPAENADQLRQYFTDADTQPDLVIDAGPLSGIPSTVIDCTGNAPILLRTGLISQSELDRMIKNF